MKKQRMVDGIIFDFGRILANFSHEKMLRNFSALTKGNYNPEGVRAVVMTPELSQAHESGALSSAEFRERVCEALSIEVPDDAFNLAWANIFNENPGLSELVASISPDIKTCVLSNTDPIHWSMIEKIPVMARHFSDPSKLALSFRVGARKPNKKMYSAALAIVKTPIERTLFIDDIPAYTDAFATLGGKTISYDCSREGAEVLEDRLQKFGVFQH